MKSLIQQIRCVISLSICLSLSLSLFGESQCGASISQNQQASTDNANNLLTGTTIGSQYISLSKGNAASKPYRRYVAWVKYVKKEGVKSFKEKGYLHSLGDSSIFLSPGDFAQRKWRKRIIINGAPKEISLEKISTIRYRKEGSRGKGALWGAIIGLFVNFYFVTKKIIDDSPLVDYTEVPADLAIMSPFVLLGALIGNIVGSFWKTFYINGNPGAFKHYNTRSRMKKYINE